MAYSVLIPTLGRAAILRETILSILNQTRPPDEIILSVLTEEDVLPETRALAVVRVVTGPRGISHQRNAALRAISPGSEFATFFDDDVELAPDYLARAESFLRDNPDVVLIDGAVLANGDIGRAKARALVNAPATEPPRFIERRSSYGCNMNFRCSVLQHADVRFDERMPRFAWLEDLDFAVRCARHGRIGRYTGCRFVHLQAPSSSTSAQQFGYTQIINPLYLWTTGTIPSLPRVLKVWLGAIAGNVLGLVTLDRNEARARRLLGNMIGLSHALRGRIEPEYIEQMAAPPPRGK